MKLNLENLNPATRFYFDDDNPDDGYMDIRACNGKALDEIITKHTKKRAEFKHGQRHEWIERNNPAISAAVWDYCIVGWQLEDQDGNPIECSKENKIKIMQGVIFISRFYSECMKKLNASLEEKFEALDSD